MDKTCYTCKRYEHCKERKTIEKCKNVFYIKAEKYCENCGMPLENDVPWIDLCDKCMENTK